MTDAAAAVSAPTAMVAATAVEGCDDAVLRPDAAAAERENPPRKMNENINFRPPLPAVSPRSLLILKIVVVVVVGFTYLSFFLRPHTPLTYIQWRTA